MRTLKECEYLWAVSYTSLDDGHTIRDAVFTQREFAERHLEGWRLGGEPKIVQVKLWKDDQGDYYEVLLTQVDVDQPELKRKAMQKLSPQELKALGVS